MRRRWRLATALAFYALLAFFMVRYLRRMDWSQLAQLDLDPVYVLLAIPISLLPRLLQPTAWRMLIRDYGAGEPAPPYAQMTQVYATSWLGRYIPGKVAWIGAKIVLGQRHGVSAETLAATSVAEAALNLCTALALALALVGLMPGRAATGRLQADAWLLAVIALVAISVLLFPPVFNRLVSAARSIARSSSVGPPSGRLSTRALVAAGTIYLVIHALGGIPVYLILRAMYSMVSPAMIPQLTAAILLAGTLGTLAVFAPAGLGVREGILIVLLSALVPPAVAVAAAMVLRVWSIAMDALFYATSVVLVRLAGPPPPAKAGAIGSGPAPR